MIEFYRVELQSYGDDINTIETNTVEVKSMEDVKTISDLAEQFAPWTDDEYRFGNATIIPERVGVVTGGMFNIESFVEHLEKNNPTLLDGIKKIITGDDFLGEFVYFLMNVIGFYNYDENVCAIDSVDVFRVVEEKIEF